MGFVYVAVAALSLLSVGQSAPVTSCESLIQTVEIQGREQVRRSVPSLCRQCLTLSLSVYCFIIIIHFF